jgi:hypothetical protein
VSIPVNARIRAVPNFLENLQEVRDFMAQQDGACAPPRFRKLQAELMKARALLSFAPSSGRPARFLDAKTGWGQFQAEKARHLAGALGMPGLRELVLIRHVLLYAHSESEVVLLSLRHERRMAYQLPEPPA